MKDNRGFSDGRTGKGVTIYDLAREAEVSPATVSRILNGTAAVKTEKRERVMRLIEKYDYHPNAMARALTESRSRLIGMVVAHSGNSYYNSLFAACESEAYRRGYVTMLMNTHSQPAFERSTLARLCELRAEAAVICGGSIDREPLDDDFLTLLRGVRGKMRVVVGSRSPFPGIPGIMVDHAASMDLAVRYLAKLGHRKISYIYTGSQFIGTQERLKLFRETMESLFLPVREEWLIQVPDYDISSGAEGIERLLSLPEQPTALLGMNDMVTAGMLQGLLNHGFSVPEDYSLLGFDDTFVAGITTPRFSSIGYDYHDYAVRLLDAALGDEPESAEPVTRRIPVYLKERESCAAPREE
ncbi:MAG: LacI family transcriptional regulator, partial [Clostridiales bacterium]|nr:LacI family transcriptional regulator [Clostridiales bacterium]